MTLGRLPASRALRLRARGFTARPGTARAASASRLSRRRGPGCRPRRACRGASPTPSPISADISSPAPVAPVRYPRGRASCRSASAHVGASAGKPRATLQPGGHHDGLGSPSERRAERLRGPGLALALRAAATGPDARARRAPAGPSSDLPPSPGVQCRCPICAHIRPGPAPAPSTRRFAVYVIEGYVRAGDGENDAIGGDLRRFLGEIRPTRYSPVSSVGARRAERACASVPRSGARRPADG